MKLDWFRMKNECRNIMNKAHETGDDQEVLASYLLFDIASQLTKYVDDDETPSLKIIWNAFWRTSFRLKSRYINHGQIWC
ncbi:unnamed protein product [Rhizopus stolonifer]